MKQHNVLIQKSIAIFLPMHEQSIFRGIAVSLLRPVIGSNVEIDVVAPNWVADVCKQIAAAFKWLYKYFTSSSTVFIENSTFTVIIKLLHHWETPVQMVCLYNTSKAWFSYAADLPAATVMPGILFRHMRTYAAGIKNHRRCLPPACLRSWLESNFAGMPAVKTSDGF